MSAGYRQPSAEFTGNARHEAAGYVKVLAGSKSLEGQKVTRK
jgi:hypothetical protein